MHRPNLGTTPTGGGWRGGGGGIIGQSRRRLGGRDHRVITETVTGGLGNRALLLLCAPFFWFFIARSTRVICGASTCHGTCRHMYVEQSIAEPDPRRRRKGPFVIAGTPSLKVYTYTRPRYEPPPLPPNTAAVLSPQGHAADAGSFASRGEGGGSAQCQTPQVAGGVFGRAFGHARRAEPSQVTRAGFRRFDS